MSSRGLAAVEGPQLSSCPDVWLQDDARSASAAGCPTTDAAQDQTDSPLHTNAVMRLAAGCPLA